MRKRDPLRIISVVVIALLFATFWTLWAIRNFLPEECIARIFG